MAKKTKKSWLKGRTRGDEAVVCQAPAREHDPADAALPKAGALPLCSATGGQEMLVAKIHGREEQRGFLKSLGFVEGAPVRVISSMGRNLIVEIKGARIALDGHLAHHILVVPG